MTKQKEITDIPSSIKSILNAAETIALTGGEDDENLRGLKQARIPTIVSTIEGIKSKNPDLIISCWVNPTEMGWDLNIRGGMQKTKGGIVRYVHKNREKNTFFDEAVVSITFNTGNILPQYSTNLEEPVTYDYLGVTEMRSSIHASSGEGGFPLLPPGLDNFYSFLSLVNSNPRTSTGEENFHVIYHNSPVFPGLLLKGYFSAPGPYSFSENAENSWSLSWTASFTIADSVPRFDRIDQLRRAYGMMAEKK